MAVETLKDYEAGDTGTVRRWLDEIDLAGDWAKDWLERSREIVRRYEGECGAGQSSSFNILHSNTETLRPALFGQVPQPDVRRRVDVPGPVEREAAQVIERGIRYHNDTSDYPSEVNAAISDLLLTGRMVMRVRYMPTMVRTREPVQRVDLGDGEARFFTANLNAVDPEDVIEEGEQAFIEIERLQFERADIEHTPYDDFLHQPARKWRDVGWIAFRHWFTWDECRQAFGKKVADSTSFTARPMKGAEARSGPQPSILQQAEVWEIWDKASRQILFVSQGRSDGPLGVFEDGPDYYNLEGVFPTPEPLRSIVSPSSLIPIPEFIIYQDLADELDQITARIRDIVDTIDVRGAYDGAIPELELIMRDPRKLIPIDAWRALTDKGGLAGVIGFVDIEPQIKAFVALLQQRNALLNTIYQTIGLGDIQRSASDARETAAAQRLKGQYGQLRMTPRQRGVQQYLRDLMRLQGELMAEKFERTTLQLMTGIEITPEIDRLLRVDALRSFAIDIETDSTIVADQAAEREGIAEMLQGLTAFAQAAQGIPEGARLPLLRSVVRRFKLGRDVEVAIEEAAQQPAAPDPEAQAAAAEAQGEAEDRQIKVLDIATRAKNEAEKRTIERQKLALEQDQAQAETVIELGKMHSGGGGGARP